MSLHDQGNLVFRRVALGNALQFSELTVKVMPDGSRTIQVKGYNSDQVEALKALANGVTEAFLKQYGPGVDVIIKALQKEK